MSFLKIEGSAPLSGSVEISGSVSCSLRMLYAACYSSDDVVIENVSNVPIFDLQIRLLQDLGVKVQWLTDTKITVNASGINKYEVSKDLGELTRGSLLISGPLLYRFRKAVIPKLSQTLQINRPSNRLVETWTKLGIDVKETDSHYELDSTDIHSAEINFRSPTQSGTDHAIITSTFVKGDTIINSASEEPETDDLILFVNSLGGNVQRIEPSVIKVTGVESFKSGYGRVPSSKNELVMYATAAILTKGNLIIQNMQKNYIAPFSNLLNNLNVNFDFNQNTMRVWDTENQLVPQRIEFSNFPKLIQDWYGPICLILTNCNGESLVHNPSQPQAPEFIRDLTRMGADVEVLRPSDVGFSSHVIHDAYDIKKQGEPLSVLKIVGPKKLRGERIDVSDYFYPEVMVLAALGAEGRSEISGYEKAEKRFKNFYTNLARLGAKITV